MNKKPLYTFDNETSVGLNKVPLNSMVMIESYFGVPKYITYVDHTGVSSATTIEELITTLPATWIGVETGTGTAYDDTAIWAAVDLNTAKETDVPHPLIETAVPVGAVFTDTVYDDTAIQAEVDLNTAKVSNVDHPLVETAVPLGAVFTDTIYDDTAIAAAVALNTAKETNIAHPLVETAVPSGAVFTDTVYDDAGVMKYVENTNIGDGVNLNNFQGIGFFAVTGTNISTGSNYPVGATGGMVRNIYDFPLTYQTYEDFSTRKQFYRTGNSGFWNPWTEYAQTPEIGTNANGTYIKYEDGTLICRHRITIPSSPGATFTFPHAFNINTYSFACTQTNSSSTSVFVVKAQNPLQSTIVVAGAGFTGTIVGTYIAIGTWK